METVQRLIAARNRLGEGPLWNENEQALYWVDIEGPSIHWYHLESGQTGSWACPTWISAIAPRASAMYSGVSTYWSCNCVARKVSAARWTSGPTS